MKTHYIRNGLPHLHFIGATFAVTTNLHDAIPKSMQLKLQKDLRMRLLEIEAKKSPCKEDQVAEAHRLYQHQMEELLHVSNKQEHLLKNPEAATIVADKILAFDGLFYKCYAFTVMSNHIHLLLDFSVQLPDGYDGESELDSYTNLDIVMKRIKGGSAVAINRLFNRKGAVWKAGYYNRFIRNERHLANEYSYILNNPVKAGIVRDWREHPFTYSRAEFIPG